LFSGISPPSLPRPQRDQHRTSPEKHGPNMLALVKDLDPGEASISYGSNFLTLIVFFVILEQTLPVATFSLDLMPSFVERIDGSEDFQKFKTKATKYGLPMMLFFSEDRRILNEMKFLSAEFRRRVLVAQVRAFSVDVRKKSHLPPPIRCSLRSLLSLSDPIYKERK
jgi:hypothetical protein